MKFASQSRAPAPTSWQCLDTSLLHIIPYSLSLVPPWPSKPSNCSLWLVRQVRCETCALADRWCIAEKYTPIRNIWVGILIGPLFNFLLTVLSRKIRLSSDASYILERLYCGNSCDGQSYYLNSASLSVESPFVTDYPAALHSLDVYTHELPIVVEIQQIGSHLPEGRNLFALLGNPAPPCVKSRQKYWRLSTKHCLVCLAGRKKLISSSSAHSLSYDRSIASSTANYLRLRSNSFFNFQYLLLLLRLSGSCLLLFPLLPVPSIFSSTRWFIRQFLRETRLIQLALLYFIVCLTRSNEPTKDNKLRGVKPLI
jgi:hypothetical protein